VYCALCIVYCVLCTVYCVLCIVYCVLCTVYCALCIVHCVLCTVRDEKVLKPNFTNIKIIGKVPQDKKNTYSAVKAWINPEITFLYSKNQKLYQQFFDVLLTVHLSIFISVINQIGVQNICFTISLFHACTRFEHTCSSSGGQNCITQSLLSSHL